MPKMVATTAAHLEQITRLKDVVFWDVKPCDSSKNRRFGGTYRLHLEGNESLGRLSASYP
jgi:hypothetical protein